MRKATAKRLCLFLVALALLTLNLVSQTVSQTQAPPVSPGTADGQFTLKTGTEVVLVNVTVRDKNGNFIKDLKVDDFTVLEDGKKQTITSVDAENTDTVITAETPKTPVLRNLTATPASQSSAAAPDSLQENDLKDRRLIVLFFDLGSMQPQEVERAATSALDYIEKQMAPADLVAVVTLSNSLTVAQDFTSNKQQLSAILTALETGSNEGLGDAAAADTTGDNTDTSTDAGAAFTPDETEYNIFNTDRRLQALTSIANDLTGIQQRKSVIYFAGGLQRTGMENQTQLRIAINAATRANLSFYTVDVRGLEAIIPGGAAGGTGQRAGGGARSVGGSNAYSGRGMLSQLDTNFASQETLVTLANDTGGKAFLDTNDFTPAFTKVQEDTSSYYLLGYVSSNPARDGRYRQISIRLNRPDLKDAKLEYRRGYYAPADFQHSTKETREKQLQDELTSDLPSNDFPVYVSTGYFRLGDNRYFVPVSVVVPGSQIPFTRASEEDRATLDLIGIVRDEGKRPFGQLRDTVKFNVNTSHEVQRKNVQYDGAFLLPPGKYSVKFVIRENQTGRMGSFETSLIVPDLKTDPVKVSSIVVSNKKQAAKAKNNPLVREGSEIVPNVTRVFSSNQHLFLYYEVYDPAKPEEAPGKSAARILTNVSLYRGATKVYETPVVEGDQVNVPERKAAGFELDLPLADLKPGFYTCQINVIDDAAGKFVFPRLGLLVR
jgi:VWFA-related protein